jgi:flavin reductase (DIM6/NTAB) family NADH-FMN oxidoreductase RutF
MILDPENLEPREVYHMMVRIITPRPIAWVSTVSPAGVTNLAPYSFFNGVSAAPPSIVFCPANTREGKKKDTLVNIEAIPEFVINLVTEDNGEAMNATSAPLPPETSEIVANGLTPIPSETVRPPRIQESPIHLECRLHDIVRVGAGPLGGNLVIGIIQRIHLDPAVLGPDQRPDPARLRTLGRLGGAGYVRTTDRFEMERP